MRRERSTTRRARPEFAFREPILAIFTACLTSLGLAGCGQTDAVSAPGPAPDSASLPTAHVEVITLVPELLRHEVALTGQLVASDEVMIKPEVDGVVSAIRFIEGARVEKGQVLFQLREGRERAALQLHQAELQLAEDIYRRTQRLTKSDISSEARIAEATAGRDEAKARVALAQVELERTLIRAPFDGVAGMRHVALGDRVEEGEPLVSIASVDDLEIVFTVQEVGVALGEVGDPIHIRVIAYPGERFPGEVFFVAPSLDPATRRLVLKGAVPNPDGRLKPGMFANVDIQVDTREGAILIPESAVVYDQQGTYVWRLDAERKASRAPVQVGLRQSGRVEIVSGLEAGQRVVAVGTHKVRKPGQPIEAVEPQDAMRAARRDGTHPPVVAGEES